MRDEERTADAFLSCVFQSGTLFDRVFKTYKLMHTNQTVDFVKQKVSKERIKIFSQLFLFILNVSSVKYQWLTHGHAFF